MFYTNFLGLVPFTVSFFLFGEHAILPTIAWTTPVLAGLATSCVIAVGMSYSAFLLRASVSATSFTVVGVVCVPALS